MSVEDDHEPDPEEACAQRVLSLIQAMAQASAPAERAALARQARSALNAFQPSSAPDDEARLSAAGRTLDQCRLLLRPPINRRPI